MRRKWIYKIPAVRKMREEQHETALMINQAKQEIENDSFKDRFIESVIDRAEHHGVVNHISQRMELGFRGRPTSH